MATERQLPGYEHDINNLIDTYAVLVSELSAVGVQKFCRTTLTLLLLPCRHTMSKCCLSRPSSSYSGRVVSHTYIRSVTMGCGNLTCARWCIDRPERCVLVLLMLT